MKIVKHIPNAITCCNLLSGCTSILLTHSGHLELAGLMIFMAAVFDFFDGFAARLLKAYSTLGAQLDSLCDVVSFGVAPSFIMYSYISQIVETSPQWHLDIAGFNVLPFAAFFLAVFTPTASRCAARSSTSTPIRSCRRCGRCGRCLRLRHHR